MAKVYGLVLDDSHICGEYEYSDWVSEVFSSVEKAVEAGYEECKDGRERFSVREYVLDGGESDWHFPLEYRVSDGVLFAVKYEDSGAEYLEVYRVG